MANFYTQRSDVYITEPSGRLNMSRVYIPYTPTITVMSSSSYSSYTLTHSNFQQFAFDLSNNALFQVTFPIIVRDVVEIDTIVSMADFFRSSMKMGFGARDSDAGYPPPVLRFNAYGVYKNVPVVTTDFTWNFDSDVDYLDNGNGIKIPVSSVFSMTLQTTYGADKVRSQFTLKDFSQGNLRNQGYV